MSYSSRIPGIMAALLLLGGQARLAAQATDASHPAPVPEVGAVRASGPLTIDGVLDEGAWAAATPAADFIQADPNNGEPATQKTEVRFLFDDDALYVGARMYDDQGAAGVTTRLVRRDSDFASDHLYIRFDTYHDHLGASSFGINPSGVKADDLSNDFTWDPVWQGEARIDSLGWTAELRIPFSQLRFPRGADQTWGLQVTRAVTRLNEFSRWVNWRNNEQGSPARFGHLTGLQISGRPARLELVPYVVAQSYDRAPTSDEDDPFYRSTEQGYRTGLDLKYLLSSNLTLSATINPDFGQVEVDPAVVNLSAFETFFQERRPFFVEGSNYFGFSPFWCMFCSNASNLGLFYTRRIGRSPQGAGLANDRSEYANVPDNTTILGAAKITGRTRDGWSIALLDAVAGREKAELVMDDGSRSDMVVEPLTNYLVSRVKRDLNGGNLVLGGIVTSTIRDLGGSELSDRLTRDAEAVGFDAEAWWGERTYHFLLGTAVSRISGDTSAIRRVQQSSARYFQRPDRDNGGNGLFTDSWDPTLTSMRGYGVYSRIAKDAGDWRWELAGNVRSPGFEVNDIAFLQRTDFIWLNTNVNRQFSEPTKYYRRLGLTTGIQHQYNFHGDLTDRQWRVSGYVQLPNYWEVEGFVIRRGSFFEDRLTRGGPGVRRHGYWYWQPFVATDRRKALSFFTNPSYARHAFGEDYSLNLNAQWRPASNVSLSLGPGYDHEINGYQYVTAQDDATAAAFGGKRYVFAEVEQNTVSMDTRLNVTFTPTLSLELFAQPFISSGRYSNFKEYAAPRQIRTSTYGIDVGNITRTGTGDDREYRVDPDGSGPAAAFTFGDPDFNTRSLRGNAVLRWEYRPGSTLFLVWNQSRSDTDPFGNLDLDRDRRALFAAPANNVFLIKVNYWLNR